MSRPALEGIKVVETACGVAGPYCGKLLADLGAEVIKVEPPAGDPSRGDRGPASVDSLFLYLNTSKRGVVVDRTVEAASRRLDALIERADLVIDDGSLLVQGEASLWLSRHPSTVFGFVTPYGLTGRRAGEPGGDLTLTHASGFGNLLPTRSVDVDRAPIRLGGQQAGYHAGLILALVALSAVRGSERGRPAGVLDVSIQDVMLAMMSPMVTGNRYQDTTWSRVPDRPPAMGRMKTRDGYVILNAFDDHHFEAFRELMGNPDWCRGDEWKSMAYRVNHLMEIAPFIDAWMAEQDKDDIHRRAGRCGIPIGPINTARDVLDNPQYAARDYFVAVEHPATGTLTYPGWPYRMSGSPPSVSRPAPRLDQHSAEIDDLLARTSVVGEPAKAAMAADSAPALPLAGLRVVEMCWVWAGPYAGSMLAALGAEVIKVEGPRRTDLTRRSVVWPLPDEKPHPLPPNQGMAYNQVNLGKRSLTVDISKPEGVEVLRRLVAASDVVVDNMRPGALEKVGLGWDDLRAVRDDLIVASSSGRGYAGEERDFLGYAMVHQGIGGGAYITGYADDHPCHSGGDVDLMNAVTLAFSIVAAVRHRDRTGEGQVIDYSQCEGVTSLLGEVLLDYQRSGVLPERQANRHPTAAPHSVYRAWGVDRWVAVEVHEDPSFVRLAEAIGRPELAEDARFSTAAARKDNEEALDAELASWIRQRDRDWIVRHLTTAGVTAAPSRDGRDLYADPHLRDREAFQTVEHPELGPLELVAAPWLIDGQRPASACAPLLGADTDAILRDLGVSEGEIERLRAEKITA